ncbi:MFS transporter [Paralimibaculum aggregatum]|uniref:MFS transporter n=1 Tax=Paralimibaculum aggregatum TaxID=3036245 RepID=A0ABQ6LI58_9RHOB|nr:MFS transporter [Limibaculum sp. NKW23]GMG82968.1 MFS transporter [Limibaculum sp. NKW23]
MRVASLASFYRENLRWLGAGFALSFFSSFGQTFFISLFAGDIRAAYGLSDGGWGALYTAATLCSAAVLFQAGALADRIRLDRLAVTVLLLYALAAIAMATGQGIAVLLVAVFGLRICGQGMMGHISATAMGRWFRAHRGRAVAFAALGFSTGEAVLPSIAVAVASTVGWRETWWIVAALLALGAAPLLGWLLAEARAPQGSGADGGHPGLGGRHWTRPEVMRHRLFWGLVPAVLAPSFIGTVLFFHQVHISEVKGWSLAAMAAGYPVYAGLTITASLTGGALVDRLGPARLLPVFLLPMGAGAMLLGAVEGVGGWLLVLALTGLSQGMAQALWGGLWPELYGTRHLGAVRAMATTAMVFSTAAGPGITGLLIDAGIPFPEQGLALGIAALAICGLGLLLGREIRRLGGR